MKILLDENIDVRLKSYLLAPDLEITTVKEMKQNGLKNGKLLQLITQYNIDCWIVVDKNIPHQPEYRESSVYDHCVNMCIVIRLNS